MHPAARRSHRLLLPQRGTHVPGREIGRLVTIEKTVIENRPDRFPRESAAANGM